MPDEEVIRRLDMIISLLGIAHRDELEEAQPQIWGDKASVAILQLSLDWVDAGDLKASVAKRTRVPERTIKRRIAYLLDQGVLERRGSGRHISYRATGLI